MLVDSHAHIDGAEFDVDRNEVLARASQAGVDLILNVGTGAPSEGVLQRAVEFGDHYESIYTAIGIHPHDARFYDDDTETLIKKLAAGHPKVIAWGEIGLDFHYDNSPRDVQVNVFERQLRAAQTANLPVIIHTREAESETIAILRAEYGSAKRRGIFHCFSESQTMADAALDLGFMISFSGIVTFKKAEDLRSVALRVPLERLLIETDSPFLSPIPHRGKRNEPAFAIEVARCLANLHGLSLSEVCSITSNNFRKFFNL